MKVTRFSFLLRFGCAALLLPVLPRPGLSQATGRPPTEPNFVADFDSLWVVVRDQYAYLSDRGIDWNKVREIYRPQIGDVSTKREFVRTLERVIDELYDPHAHLQVNTAESRRLIPTDADIWAAWQRDGTARIMDVRRGSGAERAGVRVGDEVLSVGGLAVKDAVLQVLPRAMPRPTPAAADWALTAAIAGRRDLPVRLTLGRGAEHPEVSFTPGIERPSELLTSRTLADEIGYVRVNNSLGAIELIAQWDSALALLRDTRALIIDLRDTPSGGNTVVARGLMGRLIRSERPYQRHELVAEERRTGIRRSWVEYVSPRGPFTYDGKVVILVGRWTGSMGEGITIGLDAMGRGTTVGSMMARLLGATSTITLPQTSIRLNLPTERLYQVGGAPRESYVPRKKVKESADPGRDEVLQSALRLLAR